MAEVASMAERPLRTDAARNADRILRAAREVFAELGPDAQIDTIADRAGVAERTLYRRFPTKADLLRAALDQSIDENLSPAIEKALARKDPLRGLTELIEAATALGAAEHNILAAARRADALANIADRLEAAMQELTTRAQDEGLVRGDLVAEDLPRIVAMLNSVLWTMELGSDGWRRYVALVLDAITTTQPRPLPAAAPLNSPNSLDNWPM
ncbi:TetR family transcriptional regulator [Mycolicibacterium peregrinum]|jgi:AcrR family transcriptional regulator|uniref:TetR/AcrR family transcriptional regulator n=1 Tax=Mycolicibacterium peregrinum TaxID=43304 RepID=UPI0007EAA04F|nr:TetR/AcrR family transcriptional regulator [Mycolicibacterium peregrinum]OBF42057.1 TetR family transcriptional regulator [Mycolicibacterium peregrinum]